MALAWGRALLAAAWGLLLRLAPGVEVRFEMEPSSLWGASLGHSCVRRLQLRVLVVEAEIPPHIVWESHLVAFVV